MDGSWIVISSEVNQRKTTIRWYHLQVESKNDKNKFIYRVRNRLTDYKNKCKVTKGEGEGEWINYEVGINGYTLFVIDKVDKQHGSTYIA